MFSKTSFTCKENFFLIPLFFYFMIVCLEKNLFSDRPAIIFHWRLFTAAARTTEYFYDITYTSNGTNTKQYFSKTSRALREIKLPIIQTNWSLEEFDQRDTPAKTLIEDFKNYCNCKNLKLVKRMQNKGRFVFFSDEAPETVIYEDQ